MIISINKKNKGPKVIDTFNINNFDNNDLNSDMEDSFSYINAYYESSLNLQLMESCISIDEEYSCSPEVVYMPFEYE